MAKSNRPVALITGAATGVGRACALQLANVGYDIVVNYSRSEKEASETAESLEKTGTSVLTIRCDVSNDSAVRKMLEQIEREFGRLDVLVNNAARTYFIAHTDLESLTEEKWDELFAVNLKGTFFVTRAAAPLMKQSPGAAIVNVSSVAALNGMGSSIAYCASKGALNTMTKSLARALAPQIRVNAVCPGPIDTRWLRSIKNDEQIAAMVAHDPLQRVSLPDDIADAVIFLATGTTMTTGQCIVVDGGRTV